MMKKLNIWAGIILLITLLMISLLVYAKLSDETLKEVERLKWKHSFGTLIACDTMTISSSDLEYDWQSIWFEDGKLIVSTNKGKWFVEMTKMEE